MLQNNFSVVYVPCLEVTQPIGTFYVGVMEASDIVRLSYSDVRRIEQERRDVETYLGIERPLNLRRVAELRQFVSTVDASFPSGVIVAVRSADTNYNPATRELALRDDQDVAKILDGQHRLAGLDGFNKARFQVMVTIFVDMDIEEQALVFATINLEQTKVNKSLAYDLYEYAKQRSPQKTCHNIVRLLDTRAGSPFEGKIKILGTAGDPGETLSQAVFIDMLLPYISENPIRDRDMMKRNSRPSRAEAYQESTLIFRNMFLDDRDADIARVLWNYFSAVRERWGDYWTETRRGYILNRTTGFRGLMLFLPYAYVGLAKPGEIPSEEDFATLFSKVSMEGSAFTPDNFPPGTSGQTRIRDLLRSRTGL